MLYMFINLFIIMTYFSSITINMCYMRINRFNYIVFIIVMVMFRDIVNYIICMFYFLCIVIITCNIKEFIVFNSIAIIISVYGITYEPLHYHEYFNMFSLVLHVC